MAAVVFITFLVAWMPYATVSLVSALISGAEEEGHLQTGVGEFAVMASSSPNALGVLDVPSLLNWTATEYSRQTYFKPENEWSDVNNTSPASITGLGDATLSFTLDKGGEPVTRSPQPGQSGLPPVVTLIPAMFAKSHCMMNPLIYQIMNKEFREDVYVMVFGQEKAERRRGQRRKEILYERRISNSYCQSRGKKRSNTMSPSAERKNSNLMKQKNRGSHGGGGTDCWDFAFSDTEGNMERHCSMRSESV